LLKREQGSEMLAPRGESGGEEADSGDATKPSTMATVRLKAFREYGIGAQILRDLGVGRIRLISNYSRRLVNLPGYGLAVVALVPPGVSPATSLAQAPPETTSASAPAAEDAAASAPAGPRPPSRSARRSRRKAQAPQSCA